MKIAMTTRGYDKRGGISRYVAELAERFAKHHEVHVYTTCWRDVGNEDVIFHKVPSLPGPIVLNSIPFTIQNTLRFKFFGSKYGIIHINGGESLCQDVITAHSIHKAGIEFRKNNNLVKGLGFHDLYGFTTEKINYSWLRRYKKIICVSHSSKRELISCYGVPEEDIVVIPNGVNPDEFHPVDKGTLAHLRQKYSISSQDIVLVVVATEFYRKGIVELIKAVDVLVNRNYTNVRLLIVGKAQAEGSLKGDSHYRELARKLGVSKNVVFTGMVDNLNAHYNLGDIFVFPTKYDAFGIPTLEAMSCGLPVINSRIGAGELITDGYDGMHLNDPNNVEEIADKIEILLTDEKMRTILGSNARRTAMKYSWDIIAGRTMEVYENIIR